MIIESTKIVFERFSKYFPALYSGCEIQLISCDAALENLGFCQSAPCIFSVNLSDDEYLDILDGLMQMEIDAFNTEDGKSSLDSDPLYQKYKKYGWMWDILFYVKDEEND